MLKHLTVNPLNAPVTEVTSAIATNIPIGSIFDGTNWLSSISGSGLFDTIFSLIGL
jgi:hypothetical protein